MNRRNARADVLRQAPELVGRVTTLSFCPANMRMERLTDDVLHDEDGAIDGGHEIVHAAHVRMTHAPREQELFAKSLLVVFGCARLFANDLECDRLQSGSVVCKEDLAHAAFSETLLDLVAVIDDHARGDGR